MNIVVTNFYFYSLCRSNDIKRKNQNKTNSNRFFRSARSVGINYFIGCAVCVYRRYILAATDNKIQTYTEQLQRLNFIGT